MQLTQLVHWRLSGTPDVFTEKRDGAEWLVIDSNRPYRAGFYQTVQLARPIKNVILMARASLWTANGGLMIRAGLDPHGGTDPAGASIVWGNWEGPDNGWPGEPARVIGVSRALLNTSKVTVFLEGSCRWAVKNVCRFRDVQLEVEYATEPEPQPEPQPQPQPDTPGIPGQIAQTLAEIRERLERIDGYLAQWDKAQAWVDEYNGGIEV